MPITIANGISLDPKHPKSHAGMSYEITITLPISPFAPGNGLDEIPGLRLTSLAAGQSGAADGTAGKVDRFDPEEPMTAADDATESPDSKSNGVATMWLQDVPPFYALKGVLYVRG